MKKHSFKIVAALMAILMVFSFTLTACNVETNPSSVNMPEIPFIIPPDNEDKESSRNPGDISDEDLPMIPEEDEGAKIVLPENVDRDILAYTYASISIDLMSYGYEVFNAYVTTERGDEYGIAYSDGEECTNLTMTKSSIFQLAFLVILQMKLSVRHQTCCMYNL